MASDTKTPGAGNNRGAPTVRPLTADDLDTVVAIDESLSGRSRRGFFERRLHAALKDPKGFVYIGAEVDGDLRGFALVRLLGGEFGQDAAGVLDAIGVDENCAGRGMGQLLLSGIEDVLRKKGINELQTETDWRNVSLVGFLAHAGFERAPRIVLKREVSADLG